MKKALKRSLSFLLAITIIFGSAYVGLSEVDFGSLFTVKAKAATSGTTGDCTWSLDGTVLTISGNGEIGDYMRKDDMGYNVSLPRPWGDEITDVIIKNGVKSIGSGAFSDCTRLTSITIPDSVASIGYRAFAHCTSLTSITIPDSVTSIGESAFSSCKSLTSITIPDSVTSIGDGAFHYCTSLTSINVAEENADYSSFDGVLFNKGKTSLIQYPADKTNTKYVIPDSVKSIGDRAFSSCTSLTSITIPDSVTSIGESAFYWCTSLNAVYITDIAKWCNIDFKNSSSNPLFYANNLYLNGELVTKLIIPDSVTSIGNYAFENCSSLTSITIPDSVISIGDEAFYKCTSLTSVTIGDSVTSIGDEAFERCTSLMLLTIPGSVTYIGDYICLDCTNLTAINVDDSNPNYASIDGVLFNKNKTHLIQYPKGKNYTEYVIPDGVASIGDGAFYKCTSLTSITIPDSVTYIGESAFSNCTQLKDVYYKGSVADQIGINFHNECLLNATWHYAKVSKPATPKATTTNEIGGVQVTWNNVEGATKYVVFRRQGGYNTWVNVGTTTGTTLLDMNVKSGIYYVYSVRAYNKAGQYSDFVSANTQTRKFMATPKLTTIYNHVNGLAIKWNAVAGVTNGYRVYRRGAGSTYWTYLGTTKNLYFIDNAVKNKSGEYFRYTVIADGDYHSKFDTTGLYLKRLANPTLTSAVSSKSGITVKWSAIKGTTGYYVYRKTANSTWVRIAAVGGTNNTTFLDKTVKKGTTYTYTVKAVYGATTSAYNTGISCYNKY